MHFLGQKCDVLCPESRFLSSCTWISPCGVGICVWEGRWSGLPGSLQHPWLSWLLCVCRREWVHPLCCAEVHLPLWPGLGSHGAATSLRVEGGCGLGLWLWTQLSVLVWSRAGHHPGESVSPWLGLETVASDCPVLRGSSRWAARGLHIVTHFWAAMEMVVFCCNFLPLPGYVPYKKDEGRPQSASLIASRSQISCWEGSGASDVWLLVATFLFSVFPSKSKCSNTPVLLSSHYYPLQVSWTHKNQEALGHAEKQDGEEGMASAQILRRDIVE